MGVGSVGVSVDPLIPPMLYIHDCVITVNTGQRAECRAKGVRGSFTRNANSAEIQYKRYNTCYNVQVN